jgi:signal transduction histidine kinase
MLVLLAVTLTVTILNGTFDTFVAIAVPMMVGYGTMGALVASRLPRNPLGWLMIAIGLGFVLVGLSNEALTYTLVTEPGSFPLPKLIAWVASWVFVPTFAPIPLILVLFPTGRVQSPRWRLLVPAIAGSAGLLALSFILRPGPLEDVPGRIVNPTGVPALDPVIGPIVVVLFFAFLGLSVASVVALIVRFRRSVGDERQQIRWLAYLAAAAVALALAGLLTGGIGIEVVPDVLFYAFFACVGIAFPVAIAVAILKYRLYDLDLVVKKAVVAFVLVAAITAVALVVAVAIPLAVFGVSVSVLAVAVGVAIGFLMSPLRRRAQRWADRVVYGRRATPYEVLSEFAERTGGAYSTDDVLPRMAQLLAAGTGASEAQVWLRVSDDYRAAATWPPATSQPEPIRAAGEDLPSFPSPQLVSFPVRHQGELLGALTLAVPASDPMNPAKERLVRDVAGQAGLVLRNVRLIEDLRESRRRIVTAQDERARALERDIHDGAQQQLVALTVKQRLVESLIDRDPEKARRMMAEIQADTTDALQNIRDLARGIYPPLLADQGLAAALESQARKTPLPVSIDSDGIGRYPQEAEGAVYFCCLEAFQNIAKYASASRAVVRLRSEVGTLAFEVEDDGVGFEPASTPRGSGLQNMVDRLEALGGTLEVRSQPGQGTTIAGRVPVRVVRRA